MGLKLEPNLNKYKVTVTYEGRNGNEIKTTETKLSPFDDPKELETEVAGMYESFGFKGVSVAAIRIDDRANEETAPAKKFKNKRGFFGF